MARQALFLALSLALLSGTAPAQPIEWSSARPFEVRLSSFRFAPARLRLRAGQPVVLRLVNDSGGGHNFSAPEFFAAAQLRARDAAVTRGAIELDARATREIALVPRAGRYRLRCTHRFHTMLGMSGEIVVD